MVDVRGVRVAVVGVDPDSYRAKQGPPTTRRARRAHTSACHFPRIVERLPDFAFDLILAGHLHAGQICNPFPGGRVTLAHPRADRLGRVRDEGRTMHVSPGTGTTFVPFRFFARPEVTELVLRRRVKVSASSAGDALTAVIVKRRIADTVAATVTFVSDRDPLESGL